MPDETQDLTPVEHALDVLLARIVGAEESGQPLDRQALLAQHPQHAVELREFFANRDQMQRLASPLREGVGGGNGQARTKLRYFGDYELLDEIAAGGMGIVYKARQVSLNRIVAVKMILRGTLASEDDVKRFRAEAEAAANLQHPGIVAIHEVGLHEGQHYFSMDFVDGQSLAQLPREQPLPAVRAAEYVREAAEAVHYAHQQGTLHRDLKPSNILIDRQGRVRITDFGLAKRIEGNSDLTLTGQVLGTPSYMPPEQALGKKALIGTASDVYSIGAVLYELLAGRPPFRGESPVETLRQVETLDPVAPRLLNPAAPRDLETICLKCLEKEPHKRYATAQLFADDLGRFLRHEPILARHISRSGRIWRWVRRHPAMAGLYCALAAALLALVGLGVGYRYQRELETVNRALHGTNAELARALEAEARAQRELDRELYLRRVSLAHSAWTGNDLGSARQLLEECPPQRRNWEWRYLNRICHLEQQTILEHTATKARPQVLSADRTLIAGVSGNDQVVVWRTDTGEKVLGKNFGGKFPYISDLEFSADGKCLAAGGGASARIWDLATGTETFNVDELPSSVTDVAIRSDGKQIAIALRLIFTPERIVRYQGGVQVWDAETGKRIFDFTGGISDAQCVAFSPDGNRLAAGGIARVVLWDAVEGKVLRALQGHTGTVTCLAFSSDGVQIASGGTDRKVMIWEAESGKRINTLAGHANELRGVAFGPQPHQIASCDFDGVVLVWDKTDVTHTFKGHVGAADRVAFLADGKQLASSGSDGTIKIWNAASYPEVFTRDRHASAVFCIAYSPAGGRIATGGSDEKVKVWDVETGESTLTFAGHKGEIDAVAFSPDGMRIASGDRSGALKLWDAKTGEELFAIQEKGDIHSVAFSPDGARLVGEVRGYSALKVWSARDGQVLLTLTGHNFSPRFSPDGAQIAAGGISAVQIWSAETGQPIRTLAYGTPVYCVSFSPDGKWIAAGGDARTVKVWRVSTGEEVRVLRGHTLSVRSIEFSPDSSRIASSAGGEALRVWDFETGQELLTLKPADFPVGMIAFSPDGRRIVADYLASVAVWDAGE